MKAGSSKATKIMNKHSFFAPSSPAQAAKGSAATSAGRRSTLRVPDTGMDIV